MPDVHALAREQLALQLEAACAAAPPAAAVAAERAVAGDHPMARDRRARSGCARPRHRRPAPRRACRPSARRRRSSRWHPAGISRTAPSTRRSQSGRSPRSMGRSSSAPRSPARKASTPPTAVAGARPPPPGPRPGRRGRPARAPNRRSSRSANSSSVDELLERDEAAARSRPARIGPQRRGDEAVTIGHARRRIGLRPGASGTCAAYTPREYVETSPHHRRNRSRSSRCPSRA